MQQKVRAAVMVAGVALLAQRDVAAFADEAACAPRGVVPGDRVRLVAPEFRSRPVVGRVDAVGEKGLIVTLPQRPVPWSVSWCEMLRLDVSRGTYRRTRAGAKIGAVMPGIPLALFVMAGIAVGNMDCDSDCRGLPALAVGALVGVGVGAGLGAAIGSQVRTDIWEPASRVQVRASLAPRRGGMAAGLSVSF